MRTLYVAAMALAFSVSVQGQDGDVQQQLGMAGAAVGRAIESGDLVALEKLWSPKLLVNSPANKVLTRDEVFASIKNGKLKYTDYKTTVERTEIYGDVAVVMGHETYRPTFGPEKDQLLSRRFTNALQKTPEGWVMIARQATVYDPDKIHY